MDLNRKKCQSAHLCQATRFVSNPLIEWIF